jgi:outer membrane lipoprotein-sorting protein
VYFSKVKINPPLLKELFEFKVPEGVDVFEN